MDREYTEIVKEKVRNISKFLKVEFFFIAMIKDYYLDNEVMSAISHIYETDLGEKLFNHYLRSIVDASISGDAERKINNIRFYEEDKIFFVTNDDNGQIVLKEITEQNIFSFIKPSIEDYFTDFMLLPIVESDEYYLDQIGFSKLKKIHNIVGLGFLITYDYVF